MNKPQKKRFCWNCEGLVVLGEETCPFCGVSIIPASLDGQGTNFSPPYKLVGGSESSIPPSPFFTKDKASTEEPSDSSSEDSDSDPSIDGFKRFFMATLLLLSGSIFFLFGLVLCLFSHNGIFTLQWDGTLWFIYSGLSLPLLLLGWRSMIKLDDN